MRRIYYLGFSLGVISLILFRNLPNIHLITGVAAVAILLLIVFQKKAWLSFLLLIIIGLSYAILAADWQLQKSLEKTIENQDVLVQGLIDSVPEQQDGNVRFLFHIKKITQNKIVQQSFCKKIQSQSFEDCNFQGRKFQAYMDVFTACPKKTGFGLMNLQKLCDIIQNNNHYFSASEVRLTWQMPAQKIHAGDEWQLLVRLRRPHGTMNPGGFDEEQWLFSQGLRATGYVRFSQENILLNSKWYYSPLNRLRQHISEKITQLLQSNSMTGFVTALAVGVRNSITPDQWQTLRATGTNHLMAIAGLHIGLIAGFFYFFVNYAWRFSSRLLLHMPAQQAASIAALFAAFFYAALAGFSLPTQRAMIMLVIFLLAVMWRRYLPPWHALFFSLFVILLLEPLAPLSISFWLSFAAVALIIYGLSFQKKPLPVWRRWIYLQWILAIGLIPFTILFFQEISLAGFLANMIAIPLIGFIVLPLIMLGVLWLLIWPSFGAIIIKLSAKLLALVWIILQKFADMSWLQWHAAIFNQWILLLGVIGILLLFAPKKIWLRSFGALFLLPLIFFHPANPIVGTFKFTLLDVGQGLSAVVQTRHHVLVYDTGVKYNDGFDMGDAVVIPYLRTQGIHHIDMLMISHGDNDHSGGAQSVLQEMPVKKILTSVPNKFPAAITTLCQQGQHWQWDDINFLVLYPPIGQAYEDNESSCVLKITAGNKSLLLTGDIEHQSEQYLLQQEAQLLITNILVAPHHGSISSSSQAFVNAIHPQYVLFPVGYLNRYHFPNPQIVSRYQQIDADTYDSVHSGAITFTVRNDNLPIPMPQQYRLDNFHFWNSN